MEPLHRIRLKSPRLWVQLLSAITVLVGAIWAFVDFGFEPVLAVISGIGGFIAAFFVPETTPLYLLPSVPSTKPAGDTDNTENIDVQVVRPSGNVDSNSVPDKQESDRFVPVARHQLKAPLPRLVGRDKEIDDLLRYVCDEHYTVVLIHGRGGVGKTALTRNLAHRMKDRFPDAQLWLELHGYTSEHDKRTLPVSTDMLLRQVIRDLTGEQVSAEAPLDELQRRYRTVLHNQRVLLVADDAFTIEQVRPLEPPAGSVLLITSRSYMHDLAGKYHINLNLLEPDAATAMCGDECPRIGKYAAELADLCAYLPKNISLAAGWINQQAQRDIDELMEQLRRVYRREVST